MSVRQKANGRWYADIEGDRDPATGRRRRIPLGGFRTKREAERVERDALASQDRGWKGGSNETVGSYFRRWIEGVELEREATTAGHYWDNIRGYILPKFEELPLKKLTAPVLTAWYIELSKTGRKRDGKGLAPKTIRNIHVTIHKALQDAVDGEHILTVNHADGAKVPHVQKYPEPETVWTAEQVEQFLSYIEGHRMEPLITVAVLTGMRRAELCGLRWKDVHADEEEEPWLTVRNTRTQHNSRTGTTVTEKGPKTEGSRRTVELAPEAIAALKRQRQQQREDRLKAGPAWHAAEYVFTKPSGYPHKPMQVYRAFTALVQKAGMPPMTLHDLRHTMATVGLDLGLDELYVGEILGHTSTTMTRRYQHTRRPRKRDAMSQIAEAMTGKMTK